MTSPPSEEQRLRDLALLRRVRDRMDREYAQPLDVEALASGVNMSVFFRRTTPMPRWPSTATSSASRSASTS